MPRLHRLSASATVIAALLAGGDAAAFCRTSVCSVEGGTVHGKTCTPAEPDDCGVPLQWRRPCVSFSLQEQGARDVSMKEARAVVLDAFSTWTNADCGESTPSIEVFDFGEVTCDRVEYNQRAGNANIVVFRSLAWPHFSEEGEGSADTIALTTVTYDVEKGDLFDADIEVNEAENRFTTSDTEVDVDLRSVMTHEVGHFLGLAHSADLEATMFSVYDNGSVALRDLAADDLAGICATPTRPIARPRAPATASPATALARLRRPATRGRCALAPGPAPDGGGAAPALIALGIAASTGSYDQSARSASRGPSRGPRG